MAFRKQDYPPDWPAIREQVRQRSGNRCEWCGVPNHAVGWRDKTGRFHPARGNGLWGQAGRGELDFKAARAMAEQANRDEQWDARRRKWIVIVCTTAHHPDGDKMNCDPANLHFLCQADHLRIDRKHHLVVQKKNREAKRRARQPLLPLEV